MKHNTDSMTDCKRYNISWKWRKARQLSKKHEYTKKKRKNRKKTMKIIIQASILEKKMVNMRLVQYGKNNVYIMVMTCSSACVKNVIT